MATLPDWSVSQWFNTNDTPLSLIELRGKIVVIEAFQMLCPGCVLHGLPLAQQVQQAFPPDKVAVIGLHTVFEHHKAMTPISLKAFLYEYRITFPVGVDKAGPNNMPHTMARYGMQGTPSMLLVDHQGMLAAHHFGQISPLNLGAEIGQLIARMDAGTGECTDEGCTVPGAS